MEEESEIVKDYERMDERIKDLKREVYGNVGAYQALFDGLMENFGGSMVKLMNPQLAEHITVKDEDFGEFKDYLANFKEEGNALMTDLKEKWDMAENYVSDITNNLRGLVVKQADLMEDITKARKELEELEGKLEDKNPISEEYVRLMKVIMEKKDVYHEDGLELSLMSNYTTRYQNLLKTVIDMCDYISTGLTNENSILNIIVRGMTELEDTLEEEDEK